MYVLKYGALVLVMLYCMNKVGGLYRITMGRVYRELTTLKVPDAIHFVKWWHQGFHMFKQQTPGLV